MPIPGSAIEPTIGKNFFEYNGDAVIMIIDSIHTLNRKIDSAMNKHKHCSTLSALGWLKDIGNTVNDLALHLLMLNV